MIVRTGGNKTDRQAAIPTIPRVMDDIANGESEGPMTVQDIDLTTFDQGWAQWRTTCPLPPAENLLPITVKAGEKIPYERS